MKVLYALISVSMIALTILLAVGCQEDEELRLPIPGVASQVLISLQQDTLYTIWGDSAATTVSVTVLDIDSQPISGLRVNATVADTQLALIEFLDPVHQNITDASGRVELRYRHFWLSSWDTITAESNEIVASAPVLTCAFGGLWLSPYFNMLLSRDQVYVPGPDTITVTIRLQDSHHIGIVGVVPTVTISGGILDPLPPTDSAGFTSAYWHLPVDTGQFQIIASYYWDELCNEMTVKDTAWVDVLPAPVAQVQILATDTLYLTPGDTATTPVMVIVAGQQGQALPDRQVYIGLNNAAIGFLELVDPQSMGRTDMYGRAQFRYNAVAVGNNTIQAHCGGVYATPHEIVILNP